jgi:cAMP-dependent protein kinase regulator
MAMNEELHSDYITKKINPILEELVAALLMSKPASPMPFMIQWLRERSGESKISSSEKEELTQLRQEVARLRTKLGTVSDSNTSADEESDEDDVMEDLPART